MVTNFSEYLPLPNTIQCLLKKKTSGNIIFHKYMGFTIEPEFKKTVYRFTA